MFTVLLYKMFRVTQIRKIVTACRYFLTSRFHLLQINPLSIFHSHQVSVLNVCGKYYNEIKKIVRKSIFVCEKYKT